MVLDSSIEELRTTREGKAWLEREAKDEGAVRSFLKFLEPMGIQLYDSRDPLDFKQTPDESASG